MKKKDIRIRCWIEIDGVRFFGPGPAELLGHIEKQGSIAKAAKRMGMSYKKAWNIVTELNSRGRRPFVISRKGGSLGGGALLTENGKKVIAQYLSLTAKLNAIIDKNTGILKLI